MSTLVIKLDGLVFDYRLLESELVEMFKPFGPVVEAMLLDEEFAPDVGIVEFKNKADAENAVKKLHSTDINVEGFTCTLNVAMMDADLEFRLLTRAHILAQGTDPFDLSKRDRFVCKYVLGAEKMSNEYSMVGRLVGIGGENVKSIFRQTGARVKVDGRPRSKEDPLHVRVSAETLDALNAGKTMAEQLIKDSLADFEMWCGKNYIPVPPIRVVVVQGGAERGLGRLVTS